MTDRDRRFLHALIDALDRAHSMGAACTCPEHRVVNAYRAGERRPPTLPNLALEGVR